MNNIAILFTTFLRNDLAIKNIQSICNNWKSEYRLFIGDQNNENQFFKNILSTRWGGWGFDKFYINLPFDCGLSYSRNLLILLAAKINCKYCLITADSIKFDEQYDFTSVINFMAKYKVNKIGFELKNRIKWELDMNLIPNKHFYFSKPTSNPIIYNNINFQPIDTCKNFFIATTESLLKVPYDNDLKLCEHEDHSWRYKQANFKTCFTNYISGTYIDEKPEEYKKYRQRIYTEFQDKLRKKYNINGWMEYENGLFD